jgi:hypothetical protein
MSSGTPWIPYAERFVTIESTVTDRIPRQGTGKRSDVRWTFAGPHGVQNLAALERVKEAGDDAETLNEVWHEFRRTGCGFPAYRTLCNALQHHLD